jgi:hypothetical protein
MASWASVARTRATGAPPGNIIRRSSSSGTSSFFVVDHSVDERADAPLRSHLSRSGAGISTRLQRATAAIAAALNELAVQAETDVPVEPADIVGLRSGTRMARQRRAPAQ